MYHALGVDAMVENTEVLSALQRIERRVQSIEKWLRFSNLEKLRDILSRELGNDARRKLAYEYSDGSRGYNEVGRMAGVPGPTVQGWWGRWFTMGIMEPSPNRTGRVQRICSLRDVGLEVPTAPSTPRRGKGESKSPDTSQGLQGQATLTEGSTDGNRE